jgi:uncharacterized membrane protein YheB (UPF0754 family)
MSFKIKGTGLRSKYNNKYVKDGSGTAYLMSYDGDGTYSIYEEITSEITGNEALKFIGHQNYETISDSVIAQRWEVFDEKPLNHDSRKSQRKT